MIKITRIPLIAFILINLGCSPEPNYWENLDEEGSFLVYRRQSQIGEENFSIQTIEDKIIVKSLQGENERGRITGVVAELHLKSDLSPIYYENIRIANEDTTNILRVETTSDSVIYWEKKMPSVSVVAPKTFFPLHSNIPAGMELMLYHYYFKNGSKPIPTYPRGEVKLTQKGEDVVSIKGKPVILKRYVVEGINWGGRTVWLDKDNNLIALVKANTQIREIIRKVLKMQCQHL